MMDQWAQSENERTQANMIRLGVVTELDEENAQVKVRFGGMDSDWLPWMAPRAGGKRVWSAFRPGEQVLVACPFGDTAQGVILGSLFQDDQPAPASSQDVDLTEFPDGTTVQYNSETNTLQIDVAGDAQVIINCKVATVAASTSITLDTPACTITGDLTVEGDTTFSGASVTHDGKNIGKDHKHKDVQAGAALSGDPV